MKPIVREIPDAAWVQLPWQFESNGHKLTIERTPEGKLRTTRISIHESDADSQTDVCADLVDVLFSISQAFAEVTGLPLDQVALVQMPDPSRSEYVLYIESLHPVHRPADLPELPALPDPNVIDI